MGIPLPATTPTAPGGLEPSVRAPRHALRFSLASGAWGTPLAIALVGLGLRLFHIDAESAWSDEAFSLMVCPLPLAELTAKIMDISTNLYPPLHYYLLHAWFAVFGPGPFSGRALSTLFGTLAIVMIYVVAQTLFDRRTAILSATLLAVSQLGVLYSQEARPYTTILFFLLCAIQLFIVALRERRRAAWWGFVGFAILLIYTHYYTLFAAAALLAFAFLYRKRYPLPRAWWIGGGVVALAVYIPWFVTSDVIAQALNTRTVQHAQPQWFAIHWWTFLASMNDFNNGRLNGFHVAPPLWTFVAGGLLFGVPALLALKLIVEPRAAVAERESVALLGLLWILPLLLAIGMGLLNVQYDVRYVLFCIIPYYVLVARGITRVTPLPLRGLLVVLILVYSGYALRANYFIPRNENYRDALAYLARESRDGDCCTFLPFEGLPWQWPVYHSDHPGLRLATLDAVASGKTQCNRVWLTTYRRVDWAVQKDEAGERRLQLTHNKVDERRYFWVNVSLYVPR